MQHTVVVRPARDLPPMILDLLGEEDRDGLAVIERAPQFVKLCAITHDPTHARQVADATARIYGATRA